MTHKISPRPYHPDLPELAFLVHAVTGKPVAIKAGQKGYFETDYDEATYALSPSEWVDRENARLGVTNQQLKAMEFGSMFGWHLTMAEPSAWPAGEAVA